MAGRRPDVEISFAGPRAAAAFLGQILGRPESRRIDMELSGAGRRLSFRLTVDSWRRDVEPGDHGFTEHLMRCVQAVGGSVRALAGGPEGEIAEIAALAVELRAVQADVVRLSRRAGATVAAQDELGWEEAGRIDAACRIERGLSQAAEPLERLVAILDDVARTKPPTRRLVPR